MSTAICSNLDQSKILLSVNQLKLCCLLEVTPTDKQNPPSLKCFETSGHNFNPFPNKPWFLCVCSSSLLKTLWEKEKLLAMSNFSFSHNVFYLFGELTAIFNKLEIVVCKLFSVWKGLKFVVGEGLRKNNPLQMAH